MIRKYWEVECDNCGSVEHNSGTKCDTEKILSEYGWIITAKRKHYCCENCRTLKEDEV